MEAGLKTLNELLTDNQQYEMLNGIDVSRNHVAMTLIAIYRLGAASEQMTAYYSSKHKKQILPSVGDTIPINEENWHQFLGTSGSTSYILFFLDKVDAGGVERTLNTYLPKLISGVVAHAYHPLLRLAYGIDIKNEREIAFALAYFASTYHKGPAAISKGVPGTFSEMLSKMTVKEFLEKVDANGNNIESRISQVFNSPEFLNRLGPLDFDNDDPTKIISKEIMYAFEKIHDFTLLHGVTSCHAMRTVLPYISDQKKAVTEYCYSLCAAYVSVLKARTEIKSSPLPEYDSNESSLKIKAVKSMNEHTIKLVYTCFKEYEIYKRPEYLQLITREVLTPAQFK